MGWTLSNTPCRPLACPYVLANLHILGRGKNLCKMCWVNSGVYVEALKNVVSIVVHKVTEQAFPPIFPISFLFFNPRWGKKKSKYLLIENYCSFLIVTRHLRTAPKKNLSATRWLWSRLAFCNLENIKIGVMSSISDDGGICPMSFGCCQSKERCPSISARLLHWSDWNWH